MQQTLSPNAEDGGDNSELNLDNETIENIEVLLKVLKGRMDRNMAEKVAHPGGQPRKWRRMTNLQISSTQIQWRVPSGMTMSTHNCHACCCGSALIAAESSPSCAILARPWRVFIPNGLHR